MNYPVTGLEDQISSFAIFNVERLPAYIPLQLFGRKYQKNKNKCIFLNLFI